jgi:hypothetical protein
VDGKALGCGRVCKFSPPPAQGHTITIICALLCPASIQAYASLRFQICNPGYSSVGRASDCRVLQQSDGPWFDSGWPDLQFGFGAGSLGSEPQLWSARPAHLEVTGEASLKTVSRTFPRCPNIIQNSLPRCPHISPTISRPLKARSTRMP